MKTYNERKIGIRIAKRLVFYVGILSSICVFAERGDWRSETDVHATLNTYQGSLTQDYLYSVGVAWRSRYLDSGEIGFGYSNNQNIGKAVQTNVNENVIFVNGQYFYYPDSLPGKVVIEGDLFYVTGSNFIRLTDPVPEPNPNPNPAISAMADPNPNPNPKPNPMSNMGKFGNVTLINSTNDIVVVYPQISYMNYKKTFYADVGYAGSRYRYNDNQAENVDVDQWTATVGFAWNNQFDWLQTRVFSMHLSNGAQTGGETSGGALELKWTHWFSINAAEGVDNITTSLMAGKRFFTVDPDSHVVFSISDQQTASISLAVQWKMSGRSKITTVVGLDAYEDIAIQDQYTSGYIYFNLTNQW